MLFQGQEFSASAPFLYFADFDAELDEAVRNGRAEFLTQFPSVVESRGAGARSPIPAPRETFERCKLDFSERQTHATAYALHQDLLRLRRDEPVFRAAPRGGVDGAVLSSVGVRAAVLHARPPRGSPARRQPRHRNRARLVCRAAAGAAGADCDWQMRWSSEDRDYGGAGTAELFAGRLLAHSRRNRAVCSCPAARRPRRHSSAPPDGVRSADADLIRRIAVAARRADRSRIAGHARVARHQRPRRLRVGHGARRDHARAITAC